MMEQAVPRPARREGDPHLADGPHLADWGPETGIAAGLRELVSLQAWAGGLKLPPAARVRSLQAGGWRSPFRGRGMEFAEVRAYAPGDDVRSIDWKVTARRGRTHTKLYHEERDRPILLFVDLRAAMRFGTRIAFKSVAAARAAALAGWAGLGQGDRIGGLVLADDGLHSLAPRRERRQLLHLLRAISGATRGEAGPVMAAPGGPGLLLALRRLRHMAQPGSLVLLFSDFHDLDGPARQELSRLGRQADGLAFLVHDALEAEPPPPGRYRVSDGGEGLALLHADDADWRRAWQAGFARRRAELAMACRGGGIAPCLLPAAADPVRVLADPLDRPLPAGGVQ